jgi:hypothetical protein
MPAGAGTAVASVVASLCAGCLIATDLNKHLVKSKLSRLPELESVQVKFKSPKEAHHVKSKDYLSISLGN